MCFFPENKTSGDWRDSSETFINGVFATIFSHRFTMFMVISFRLLVTCGD